MVRHEIGLLSLRKGGTRRFHGSGRMESIEP